MLSSAAASILPLALLLAPALAGGPPQPGQNVPPKVDPTKLDTFAWTDPFASPDLRRFSAACQAARTFAAAEYQLHDLDQPDPRGLAPYQDALKGFFGGRPYPGGWGGVDAHGYERNLLKMAYADVPVAVRRWIAAEEKGAGAGKGLFAVFEKPATPGMRVTRTEDFSEDADAEDEDELRLLDEKRIVIFAPGAVYETLPLWVAEGSGCQDALEDVGNYSPELVEGGIVGWATNYTTAKRSKGERKVEFTLKAQVLGPKADQEASSADKEPQDASSETDSKDEL